MINFFAVVGVRDGRLWLHVDGDLGATFLETDIIDYKLKDVSLINDCPAFLYVFVAKTANRLKKMMRSSFWDLKQTVGCNILL